MIEVRQLTYSYPRRSVPALREVTFSANRGEFVGLIGASGAGKSTLCYALNGCVPRLFGGEMSGQVQVAGLDTYENEIPVMAQHVGLVVQNARSQLFNVTVLNEVVFGCENLGLPRPELLARAKEALDFVGLSGFEDRQPAALSGGQQQRVAIACVLAMRPEVLVLDEPTSELDPIGSEQVMQVIYRLNRELGKTVFLVTHDMEMITTCAGRLLVLHQGELLEDGSPRKIFANPDLILRAHIRPPQVCAVGYGLLQAGHPLPELPLTLEDARRIFQRLSV